MNAKTLRFFAFVGPMAIAGAWLGFALSRLPKLAAYKLLNITGILYGLLGILVLAELVMRNDELKRFMVTYVAAAVLWGSMVVPVGMLVGSGLAYAAGQPSAGAAAGWSLSFLAWSMLPLSAVDATVLAPTRLLTIDLHGRHQIFGLALLLGGGTLQLAAAVLDLVA